MKPGRREVRIQLDDALAERLDEMATTLGVDRSEVARRAVQAVLDTYEAADADLRLQNAYRRQPPDPGLLQSARRLAAETAAAW